MRNIIIGTAGHVDHGKTTLIKALTGVDTDRLKEEKERGMTIDLGFASLTFANGQTVGIVDVPGHERFIKNMLAGAGGVDVALLVIAADESVMPQTVEHLEILSLLEIKRGVVALTKAGLVDPEWLDVVVEDVRQALRGTFLSDSPVVPVDSVSGTGISELLDALQSACEQVEARDSFGPFRLPVDRVFTLQGFGTVVTGTLVSGTVRVGDPAEILPTGLQTRVRQIQVHGRKSEVATAGSRVALNLAGLQVEDLSRGDICTAPDVLKASTLFDLRLILLENAPKALKSRTRVRLHIGTAELIGRITLLDKEELRPGEEGYAQFKSETPSAAMRGDRFVIRSYSPMLTIGGGIVLDPNPTRHRRFDEGTLRSLEARSYGTPVELLDQSLRKISSGTSAAELRKSCDVTDLEAVLGRLLENGTAIQLDSGKILHAAVLADYNARILGGLDQFHAKYPLKPGISREELRGVLRGVDAKLFASILLRLVSDGRVETSDTLVWHSGKEPSMTEAQRKAAESIVEVLSRSGINVPAVDELVRMSGLPENMAHEIIDLLAHQGRIVKVDEGLYFHPSVIARAEQVLRDFLAKNGKVTVSQFRDITDSSRKYALPLLEYFDGKRITRRLGDERVLFKRTEGT